MSPTPRPPPSLAAALAVATLAACAAAGAGDEAAPPPSRPPDTSPPSLDVPPPPGTLPLACGDLHADGALPTYEVEIAGADWAAIQQEALAGQEIYHPIVFRMGSESASAMMRLRGGNSRCGDKLQFAISFNQVDRAARFHGLRRIDLDHGGCRLLHERLAMAYLRDLGVPAPCVNNARLVVNGSTYGLFVNLEHVNQDFLERNFGEEGDGGNLYKNGQLLRTNEALGDTSDLAAFRAAPDLATLATLADLDEAVQEWAGEAVLPVHDNFWSDGWNYYLYHHPTRGFLFVPNDIDMPLTTYGAQPIVPPMLQYPANLVLADPAARARFDEAVRRAIAAFDPALFDARLDRWWAQIATAAAEDPFADYAGHVADLRQKMHDRAEWLRAVADDPASW